MPILFKENAECCGCSACYAACPTQAITMLQDREGFRYPVIDSQKCVECGACVAVCPLKEQREDYVSPSVFRAAKHRSEKVRLSSSSGGVFTAVSDHILKQGGAVYGVVYDEAFTAVHEEQRDAMRVSKYQQSDMGDTFRKVKRDLSTGRTVLFTGTPCQVAGLKKFLKKDYDNLITVDVVCHGTPSPLMFREHIKHLEKVKKSRVVGYYCRAKELGWHKHIEKAVFENGKTEYGTPLGQEHKVLFYAGHILRPSCYECHYTNLNRPSDLSLADFWGVEKCMPDYDDQIGISMLLVNTPKGEALLRAVDPAIDIRPSETYGRQPHLEKSAYKPQDRAEFWDLYFKRGYAAVAAKYGRNSFVDRAKFTIKKMLKM